MPIVPTDAKNVKWPFLTADVDVAFYDELEPITESDPTLDDYEVPVKSLKALVRTSTEAAEDSDPDLLQLLTDNINIAMALKGDRERVAGADAKGFAGLLNVADTQSVAVDGELSWDHVIKAVGLLIESNVPGPYATLLGPRPATALALTKEDATSNAYLQRPEAVPPVFNTGWLPVTGTAPDEVTTAVVYAPGQQMIVLRRAVTVEIDRSEEFSKDAILARGRYRLGLGVPHPQSIVKQRGERKGLQLGGPSRSIWGLRTGRTHASSRRLSTQASAYSRRPTASRGACAFMSNTSGRRVFSLSRGAPL